MVKWARELPARYPFWSLQPRRYAALNKTDLPTTYPLPKLVKSIAGDEEGLVSPDGMVEGLPALIDARRCKLCRGDSWGPEYVERVGEGRYEVSSIQLGLRFPSIVDGPILAFNEPDTEYTIGGYYSPYEEIGMELVSLVEAREAASGTSEGAEAQDRLDEFLGRVAGRARGRPTSLRDDVGRALFEEGRSFVAVCWEALVTPIALHDDTRAVLAALGVAEADHELSALQLALPNLSTRELLALRDRARAVNNRTAPSTSVEGFTVHVLAHRLRVGVSTVSRKVFDGWTAEALVAPGAACVICDQVH
jgi:hypothetical protein